MSARLLSALLLLLSLTRLLVAADEGVPPNACILELTAPPNARIIVDGRDFGTQRKLTFNNLPGDKLLLSKMVARFPDGSQQERQVWVGAGRRIRVPFQPLKANRPELALQTGHNGTADHAVFSLDGNYLVTAYRNSAILWSVETGRQLRTIAGHSSDIAGLAISPDGKRIYTASLFDSHLIVSDRDTGRQLIRVPLDVGSCWSIAISPDGLQLAVGGSLGSEKVGGESRDLPSNLVLLDAITGQRIRYFQDPHGTRIESVSFSPDGRRLISGSDDHMAVIWDVLTGRRIRQLAGHAEKEVNAAYCSDGSRIATSSRKFDYESRIARGDIAVWDAAAGSRVAYRQLESAPQSIALNPGTHQVVLRHQSYGAAGNREDLLTILKTADLAIEQTKLEAKDSSYGALVFSADGKWIFDGQVIWDFASGKVQHVLEGRQAWVSMAIYVPQVQGIVVKDGNSVRLLDVSTGASRWMIPAEAGDMHDAYVTHNGRRMVGLLHGFGKKPTELIAWDTMDGRVLNRFLVATDSHCELSITEDARFGLVRANNAATLWNLDQQQPVRSFKDGDAKVYWSAISADGRFLVVNSSESSRSSSGEYIYSMFALFDVSSGSRRRSLIYTTKYLPSLSRPQFSSDGQFLITSGYQYAESMDRGVVVFFSTATGEPVKTLAAQQKKVDFFQMTPNGLYGVAHDHEGTISTVWDLRSNRPLRSFQGHFPYNSPSLTPDGRRLLSVLGDGTLRWSDVATGEELVRYVPFKDSGDWLAVTPQGLFDGTEAARKNVAFRVGGGLNLVPIERFFQDFYYPGLLAAIMRGERPTPTGELAARLAPAVTILSPQPGVSVSAQKVQLQVEVTDRGGGVDGPWLMQNGARVLVDGDRKVDGKAVRRTFDVALVEGENLFEVRAASSDGSWESEPAVLVLRFDRPVARPAVHLVAVGINKYAEEAMNLKFAAPDARAMAQLFQTRGPTLYGPEQVHVVELVDGQATQEGIRSALASVAKRANPQDTLVVFLAGHGTTVGQRYFFITHEFRKMADKLDEDIRQQGLAGDVLGELVSKVPALKRVMIFDTCQSGSAIPLERTARDPFAFRGALERLSHSQGVFTIAAASASTEAQEAPQLKHGMLTYALLAGMGAVSDGPLAGQSIRPAAGNVAEVREWFGFAQDKVPLLTKLYFGQEQFIGFTGQGASFPVLPIEAAK